MTRGSGSARSACRSAVPPAVPGDRQAGGPKLEAWLRLRVALAQVNATVGDLAGNAEIIVEWTRRAAARGARVVVFPEMALTGYPVEDLALRASFVEASIAALRDVAERLNVEGLGGVAVVAGYLDRRAGLAPRTGLPAGAPLDAAAVLHGGRVVITSAKHHLPNYGVFDEFRYFVPGNTLPVFRVPVPETGEAVDVAVAICEDLWQDGGPVAVTRHAGAALLVVPNASPYERGKDDVRLDLVQRRAREAGAALAYCNLVGGQDELVFDGDSILVSAAGEPLARGPQFEEALIVADLDLPRPRCGRAAWPARRHAADADGALPQSSGAGEAVDAGDGTLITIERVTLPDIPCGGAAARRGRRGCGRRRGRKPRGHGRTPGGPFWPRLDDLAEVYAALVLGTADYVRKNGFCSVLLALSGGIDSALVATIAADAVGPENVSVILMPSKWSSGPLGDRRRGPGRAAGASTRGRSRSRRSWTRSGDGLGGLPRGRAARGEPAVPGARRDQHGGVQRRGAPRAHHRQQERDRDRVLHPVRRLGRRVRRRSRTCRRRWSGRCPGGATRRRSGWGALPRSRRTRSSKPPSAELAPGQLDTDSLPDYEVLDALLDDYVEKDMGSAELIAAGHDPALVARVIRLVDLAEYKRRQYPPGPKISQKNFGRDRRLPITSRWREVVGG